MRKYKSPAVDGGLLLSLLWRAGRWLVAFSVFAKELCVLVGGRMVFDHQAGACQSTAMDTQEQHV